MWGRGLELELGFNNKLGDLFLNVKGNASFTRNKITDIGSNEYLTNATMQSSAYEVSRKVVGQPVNEFYGFKYLGVSSRSLKLMHMSIRREIKSSQMPSQRLSEWLDVDGNGIINSSDRTWLGNPDPNFTYGFTLNLAYKGFDLVAFGRVRE